MAYACHCRLLRPDVQISYFGQLTKSRVCWPQASTTIAEGGCSFSTDATTPVGDLLIAGKCGLKRMGCRGLG